MDIKSKQKTGKGRNKVEKSEDKVKKSWSAGEVISPDSTLVLPPFVQIKLLELGQRYGLNFELDKISLDGTLADKVRAVRIISDMAVADSKLLPEMLKSIKKLLRAEISLAKYHKSVSEAALKHQEKLDKVTSELFLKMAGYSDRSSRRELKTNQRLALLEKRSKQYEEYYQTSVFGAESQLIDVEFEVLGATKEALKDSKIERKKLDGSRKVRIQEYIDSAYKD